MSYFTYLPCIFFVSEFILLIVKRSNKDTVKKQSDSRSLLVLWIVISLSIFAGGYLSVYNLWPVAYSFQIGIAISIIGFIIRWVSILQLGKMFTVDVSISSTHNLKTNGLYNIVRHPSYLGLLLIIAGIAVTMGSLLSCLVVIIPVFFALNYRIIVEEKVLIDEFGNEYINYCKRVSRLIPWLY
jgi:protein-S-isoprenylcysteine O-methyltransferase Ste14